MGDAARLQQVVWNLLGNAIKFTPKAGHVEIQLRSAGSSAEIVVTDNGEGIAPEFIPALFNRLTQADTTMTRGHGGLGLGLSIVRHVVEAHGGTVTAQSDGKGQGATFTVRLPLCAVLQSPEAASKSPTPPALKAVPFLKGLRVLFVEDDPDNLAFIAAALEQYGAALTTANSAARALECMRESPPDVIVSDIGMPDEDGYSLIRKIRQLPPESGGGTPAVALTAFAKTEDRIRALSSGFQMHVPKPIDPAELATVLASVVRRTLSSP
jgi:hypothetical protein